MVAIFTGLGAGFERGSSSALGSGGLLGSSAFGRGGEGVFLNAANGNLVLSRQDEFLVGRGPDVAISRIYNSLGALDDNGDHWRQSTDRRVFGLTGTVNTTGSTIKRVGADGAEITYVWKGSYYEATDGAGAHDRLTYASSVWTWVEGSSHSTETYEDAGSGVWRIATQRDSDGNQLTFTYTSGKLTRVATQDGSYVDYTWSGSNITTVVTSYTDLETSTAKTLTRTRYAYDGQNRLITVTVDLSPGDNAIADGQVYTTSYTYHGTSNRIATITQTDGSLLTIAYDGSNRVSSLALTAASGDTRTTSVVYEAGYTKITDPRNQETKLYHNAQGQLTKVEAPPAHSSAAAQTVEYTYDADGNVTRITDAGGGFTDFVISAAGNVTRITDQNGNITDRTYNSNNNLLTETRTGSHGGSSSASLTTRYVYDSENHLRYVISPDGRVTEYRYSSEGEQLRTIEYPEHIYAIGSTAPSLGTMNTWRDGLADRSSTRITHYTYDARGALISATSYGRAATDGGASTSEGAGKTIYVYDQAGQLLSVSTQPHGVETYVYDGLGRLTATTDINGGVTTYVFSDAATTTTVTTGSSFTTVSTYNKAGELLSRADSGAYSYVGTANYLYDRNGQVRRVTDATSRKSYFLYDKTGRKIADIGHDGQLIEYRYDQAGRLVATGRYTNLVSAGTLTTLDDPTSELEITAVRPTADLAHDIWQWSVYDAAGRVIETIQGNGAVTTYEYDQSNRLIKTTGYHNKLSTTQIDTLIGAPPSTALLPTAHAKDAVIRTFYNRDGMVIGALNAEGYLSSVIYDGAGLKVQEIAYAAATNVALRASGTYDQLLASVTPDAAKDVSQRQVHDGQGLLRFSIDAIGRVTEYIYWQGTTSYANGLVRRTIAYAAPLGALGNYSYLTVKAAVAALASDPANRTSYAVYNTKGQLAYAVDGVGAVTGYTYDIGGRVTKIVQFAATVVMSSMGTDAQWKGNLDTWAASNGANARITRNYYATRGDLRFTIDAEGYATEFHQDAEGRTYNQFRYTTKFTPTDAWTIGTIASAVVGQTYAWTQYRYDNLGRLQDVYDANGTRHYTGYFANGTVSWEIVAYGQTGESRVLHEYDRAGRRIKQAAAYGTSEQADTYFAYDGLGNLTSTTDPRNNTTTFTYDKAGRVLTRTDALSGVTTYEYDGFGRGVKVTDARNNASYSYFDQLGRVKLTIDAESYATETTYTAFGEVATVKRRHEKATGVGDWQVLPSLSTHALDATTSFEYDKMGRVTKTTDALDGYEEYTLNAFGQRTHARNKLGGVTQYAYDLRGLLVTETLPINAVRADGTVQASSVVNTFEYDARGNQTKRIEAYGLTEQRTTIYAYDIADRLVSVTGDQLSVVASATGAPSNVTPVSQMFYDRRGNVIESRDAAGARTLYWYDKLDRVTHQVSPTGTVTRYFYDANGNVTEVRVYATQITLPADATGAAPAGSGDTRVTQYQYDALNRLKKTITPNINVATYVSNLSVGVLTLETEFFYDAMGNVVRAVDAKGAETWSYYDKLGRKTVEVDAGNYRTDWTYNSDGNVLTERRYSAVSSTPTGTVTPPSAPSANNDDRVTNFTYDKMGRRLTEARTGVLVHSGAGAHISQTATITYAYNALGEVTRKTEATGEYIDYAYDVGGRMTSEQRSGYTDFNGVAINPRVEYAYNGLNDLSRTRQVGSTGTVNVAERITQYTYGAGGRLLTLSDPENFVRTYRYDSAGRVTREEYTRITPTSSFTEAKGYDYDLEGRVTAQGALVYQSGAWTRTSAAIDTAMMRYNAFGEIYERGLNNVYAEKFDYDAAGRLWRTNTGDGAWKYFLYDQVGNQTLMIASDGANIDAQTLTAVLDLWGANRAHIGTSYVDGVVATITRYDARNQAIEVREPQRERAVGVLDNLVTTRAYNAFGEVSYEVNAGGHRIDYAYNTMGRLIRTESPAVEARGENGNWIVGYVGDTPSATSTTATTFRPIEHRYYDISGRLVASRDANGNLTRMTLLVGSGYGGAEALVTQVKTADDATVNTAYDIHGDARRITDQIDRITTQTFDKLGRLTQVVQPGGLIETHVYDGLGQRIKRWNSLLGESNAEKVTFDQQGRVTQHIAMGGDTTSTTYAWSSAIATAGMGTFGGWTQTTTYANSKTITEQSDVFGHAVSKTDMGARVSTYSYDKAGRLTQRSGGDAVNYAYLNTGRVGEIYRFKTTLTGWERPRTIYTYDQLGNVLTENYSFVGVIDYWTEGWWEDISTNPYEPYYIWHDPEHIYAEITQVYANATATYDALGRLKTWSEAGSNNTPPATIAHEYDANGNIRRSLSTFRTLNAQGVASSTASTHDHWYRYDALNRVVTAKGQLQSGAIVRGFAGVDLFYDAAGQRAYTLTSFWDTYIVYEWNNAWPEPEYVPVQYSFINAKREDYAYDAAGRLAQVNVGQGYFNTSTMQAVLPGAGGVKRGDFAYDALGRLTLQRDYEANGTTVAFSRAVAYNSKSQITTDTTDTKRGAIVYRGVSTYTYGSGTSYALGSALSIATANYQNSVFQYNSSTTNTYQWWDGAIQNSIAFTSGGAETPHTSTYNYFTIGGRAELITVNINDAAPRAAIYRTDMNGQVIRRDETAIPAPHEVWYRFAGKQIGATGNNGTLDSDYTQSIANRTTTPGSGRFRFGGANPITHVDFDQSVAPITSYFQGNSGGIYTAQAGDTLAGIAARVWGDSSLWYKIAEANGITGNTAPLSEGQTLVLPTGVIRSSHNAKTFTPYDPSETLGETAPNRTQPLPPKQKCGGMGQAILTIIAVIVTIVVAIWLPEAIPALEPMWAAVGAIAGAAGSIVSQGVGVATGIQNKFSWNAVALSAIGGAVGGAIAPGAGATTSGATSAAVAQAVVRGMAASVITQGIGVATGLQDKFSWAGVAAAGVGAGVGLATKSSGPVVQTAARTIAVAATRSLIDGNSFGDSLIASLPDVIGQTIGEAIAGEIARRGRANAVAEDPIYEQNRMRALERALAANNPELFAPLDIPKISDLSFGGDGSQTYSVSRGDTVEAIARATYGDSWRAGVAAIIGANNLRANANGSPLIYAGSDIVLPGLSGLDVDALSRVGGNIIANNSQRLSFNAQLDAMSTALSVVTFADQMMVQSYGQRMRAPTPMIGANLGQYPVLNFMLGGNVRDSSGMTLYHRGTMLGDGLNFAGAMFATGMALTGLGVAAVELPALMLANPATTTGLFEAATGLVPGMEAATTVSALGVAAHRTGVLDDAWDYAAAAACFVAGTLVHTREGLKPIEAVKAGDFVLAQPEFQGERAYRRVKETFQREPQSLVEVTVASGGRRETITATSEHPFWVQDAGWTSASDLKEGDVVELANGSDARIVGIEQLAAQQPVFNFAVDGFHTYYVGELGVWVHNASKIGALWRGPTEPVLIGSYTPSATLNFGTTLFGQEAHINAARILQQANGGVAFDMRVLQGERGIDVMVLRPRDIANLGFEFAEIKPLTLSGEQTLLRQSYNWNLKPQQIQPITYDAKGNIYFGF